MAGIGTFALYFAVVSFTLASLLALGHRPKSAQTLFSVGGLGCWVAIVVLGEAFLASDFSLTYVVDHSRASSHALYRISGIWGGIGGSLLLWATLYVSVVGVAWRTYGFDKPRTTVPAAAIAAGVMAIVALAESPFATLQIPAISGRGLTPILEHPAMVYHPVILYIGLVLTAVPFLLRTHGTSSQSKPIVLTLAVLTVGLVTGANWAYAELGWGGYWAWDPVENSALMPWLALLAALHMHCSTGSERGRAVADVAPFLLVLYGAIVTRAGVTDSVHAFGENAVVGYGLSVVFVIALIAAGLAVGRAASSQGRPQLRLSTANAILSVSVLVVVLAGTSAPLAIDLVRADARVIGGQYFAQLAAPLAVLGLLLLGWFIDTSLRVVAASSAVGAVIAAVVFGGWNDGVTLVLVGASALAGAPTLVLVLRDHRRRGQHVAHFGFAVLLLGIAGSTQTVEQQVTLAIGESIQVEGETITLVSLGVEAGDRDNVRRIVTELRVGNEAVVRPSLDGYTEVGTVLAETDLISSWKRDLQFVLRTATETTATLDIRYRPLARFVWLGAVLMAVGFSYRLVDRRVKSAFGRGVDQGSPAAVAQRQPRPRDDEERPEKRSVPDQEGQASSG